MCGDIHSIRELDYSIFTKDKYMINGKKRVEVDAVNIPVAMSSVKVCPGDLILVDDSGMLVSLHVVAEKALEIAKNNEKFERNAI